VAAPSVRTQWNQLLTLQLLRSAAAAATPLRHPPSSTQGRGGQAAAAARCHCSCQLPALAALPCWQAWPHRQVGRLTPAPTAAAAATAQPATCVALSVPAAAAATAQPAARPPSA